MEIKIGLQHVQRELSIETEAASADVEATIRDGLAAGGMITLEDTKGRKVLLAADKIAYVDLGAEHQRPVGFGTL